MGNYLTEQEIFFCEKLSCTARKSVLMGNYLTEQEMFLNKKLSCRAREV
jgi:hypothetical protein